MHEYAIQLDMQEGVTQKQQYELEEEEDNYNHLMNVLKELREAKNIKVQDYKNHIKEDMSEEI